VDANEYSMTCVGPTVSRVLGLGCLTDAIGEAIPEIVDQVGGAGRLAILAPDGLGEFAFRLWRTEMPYLGSLCRQRYVTLRSVMPSITPVNFAAMVSGTDLEGHGVRAKEMDFKCHTLFDLLRENGRTGSGVGLPGYTGSDLLARCSDVGGTAPVHDDAALETLTLSIAREHLPDFLIVQIGETDDHFHRVGPSSPLIVPKLRETDQRLERMTAALTDLDYVVIILSDHGQHDTGDPAHGGSHGTDSDEDCLVPCTWLSP
jgi:hypothetical protein